jgi:hypothetical protein
MSTLVYGAMTNKRESAQPGTSTTSSSPGIKTYADAFAALVPAEVLSLHALILASTTKVTESTAKTLGSSTLISDPITLGNAFWGLIILSVVLYVGSRLMSKMWDRLDYIRMLIPPLAFIGWTMLQRATAFDAAFPTVGEGPRTVIALFLGVVLGLAASALAYKMDQKQPT